VACNGDSSSSRQVRIHTNRSFGISPRKLKTDVILSEHLGVAKGNTSLDKGCAPSVLGLVDVLPLSPSPFVGSEALLTAIDEESRPSDFFQPASARR
jgi:hypothetical protein